MPNPIPLLMKKNDPQLIFLVGFMGSGKSTIGKLMAKQLGVNFLDTDKYIEEKEGKTIPEIFDKIGEKGFRKLENQVLNELKELKENHVIATGGGMPCHQTRLNKMLKLGTLVYLEIDVKSIIQRVTQGKNIRPILAGLTPPEMEEKIQDLMKKRLPYYEQAHHTISSLSAKKIDFKTLLG